MTEISKSWANDSCKPCGKETNHVQKKPHSTQGTKKVQIVAFGWNSIVGNVIANTRMIWRFLKQQMCQSFEVDNRLR